MAVPFAPVVVMVLLEASMVMLPNPLVLGKDTDGSVPTHLSRSLRADRVHIEQIERLESDLDIAGSGMKAVHAMRAVVPRCNVYVRQRHVERADAVMLERDTM